MNSRFAFTLALVISSSVLSTAQEGPQVEGGKSVTSGVARPNPDAMGNYHMGDGVSPPKLVHSAEPKFSRKARREKIGGVSVVSLIVSREGMAESVHIVRSIADNLAPDIRPAALELDQNAVKAVEKYRFQPATFQGKPVPYELRVELTFQTF